MLRLKGAGLLMAALLVAVPPPVRAASMYHCVTAKGKPVFSDRPCGKQQRRMAMPVAPLVHSDMALSPERIKQLDQALARQRYDNLLNQADAAISESKSQLAALKKRTDAKLDDIDDWQLAHPHANHSKARVKRRRIKRHYKELRYKWRQHIKHLEQQRRKLTH